MQFAGDLSVIEPTTVFQIFNMTSLTGAVKFITMDNTGTFYFKYGRLIHASIQSRKLKLGDILMEMGIITKEQRDGALHAYRHEKGLDRFGQILLDRGYITKEKLEEVIREQMENTVYEVLDWRRGYFVFFENEKPDNEDILLEVALDQLLIEGVRRSDEARRDEQIPEPVY